MSLEQQALGLQAAALSRDRRRADISRDGELWFWIVTKSGRELLRTVPVPMRELPETVFLPGYFVANLELWLCCQSNVFARTTLWTRQRIRFETRVVNSGIRIYALNWTKQLPQRVRTARLSIRNARIRLRRPRTTKVRRSSIRPSPQTVSVNQVRAWNREGDWMSLTSTPIETYRRTWSGTVTPGFGTKKRKALPVNPHSVYIEETRTEPQYHSDTVGPSVNWWLEPFGDPNSLSLPGSITHSDDARNLAIRRLIQRSEGGIEGNLAQDIVQMNQVVRTVTDSVTRLAQSIRLVKRGNPQAALNVLIAGKPARKVYTNPANRSQKQVSLEAQTGLGVSQQWLALQYGWKPLLHDVQGAFESLAKFNYADYSVRQVSASGKRKWVERSPIKMLNGRITVGVLQVTWESRTKIGLRYTLDSALTSFLAQTGFTNPINLFWEVLPYSFVVDWFLPIGPYLESLSGFDGLTFLDGYQTQFTRRVNSGAIYFRGTDPGNPSHEHYYDGWYESEGIKLDRIKLSAFPAQTRPSFKNPLSVEHALNGIALLRAAFSR